MKQFIISANGERPSNTAQSFDEMWSLYNRQINYKHIHTHGAVDEAGGCSVYIVVHVIVAFTLSDRKINCVI